MRTRRPTRRRPTGARPRTQRQLKEAKEELFNLRFQAATGQLESHGRLRTVRREIARIYTVLRERELGIIGYIEPEVVETEETDDTEAKAEADDAEVETTDEDAPADDTASTDKGGEDAK